MTPPEELVQRMAATFGPFQGLSTYELQVHAEGVAAVVSDARISAAKQNDENKTAVLREAYSTKKKTAK